jgi:hypothetical protein
LAFIQQGESEDQASIVAETLGRGRGDGRKEERVLLFRSDGRGKNKSPAQHRDAEKRFYRGEEKGRDGGETRMTEGDGSWESRNNGGGEKAPCCEGELRDYGVGRQHSHEMMKRPTMNEGRDGGTIMSPARFSPAAKWRTDASFRRLVTGR